MQSYREVEGNRIMTKTPEPSNTDLQLSQTNNHTKALFLSTLSALEKELDQFKKDLVLMDKESAPSSKPKQRGQTPTMRDILTRAELRTGTNYFPQAHPQEPPSTEEIAAVLEEHKASV